MATDGLADGIPTFVMLQVCTNREMVKATGKRLMVLQEPSKNKNINFGLIKELISGYIVPELYKLYKVPTKTKFKPKFKLVLTANDLPVVRLTTQGVPYNESGRWRRFDSYLKRNMRILPFISNYVC